MSLDQKTFVLLSLTASCLLLFLGGLIGAHSQRTLLHKHHFSALSDTQQTVHLPRLLGTQSIELAVLLCKHDGAKCCSQHYFAALNPFLCLFQ